MDETLDEKQHSDYLSEFNDLIGIPQDLNTLDDYKKMREQLIAWRKHQVDEVFDKYHKADSALLHAAEERGIYERTEDGIFVPAAPPECRMKVDEEGAKYWSKRLNLT